MKKIKIYIEDQTYKSGLSNLLNFYPSIKSNVELINSIDSIENQKDLTIISDTDINSNNIKLNNTTYKLSSNPVSSKNEIYKYSNIKEVLENFIDDYKILEKTNYHIYTVNSPSESSGKTIISKALAEIISDNARCAVLNILETSSENEISLSELILMSLKNKDAEEYVKISEGDFYNIPGFRLVRDYLEMDISNLKTLLNYLNKNMNIDFFIIELPASLDKSSEEIIKMSKINFIVQDKRRENQDNKLEYLEELGEKAWDKVHINNFCKLARNSNDLPIIRAGFDEDENLEFLEKDYLLFKHKLAQCLGGNYA